MKTLEEKVKEMEMHLIMLGYKKDETYSGILTGQATAQVCYDFPDSTYWIGIKLEYDVIRITLATDQVIGNLSSIENAHERLISSIEERDNNRGFYRAPPVNKK